MKSIDQGGKRGFWNPRIPLDLDDSDPSLLGSSGIRWVPRIHFSTLRLIYFTFENCRILYINLRFDNFVCSFLRRILRFIAKKFYV